MPVTNCRWEVFFCAVAGKEWTSYNCVWWASQCLVSHGYWKQPSPQSWLLLTDSHLPRRVQRNCKPNLIVCSSRCSTMVHVLLCATRSLHIALFSRHVNDRVCSNCNYFFWHWFVKIVENACTNLLQTMLKCNKPRYTYKAFQLPSFWSKLCKYSCF